MKYSHLITKGVEQDLSAVAFHHSAPLKRYVMIQKDAITGDGGFRTAAHIINGVSDNVESYCELHWHDFDEINFILSNNNSLKYKIQLEDETYTVEAPATIYIPKGIRHAAEVISGTGIYLALTFTKDYKAQQ